MWGCAVFFFVGVRKRDRITFAQKGVGDGDYSTLEANNQGGATAPGPQRTKVGIHLPHASFRNLSHSLSTLTRAHMSQAEYSSEAHTKKKEKKTYNVQRVRGEESLSLAGTSRARC